MTRSDPVTLPLLPPTQGSQARSPSRIGPRVLCMARADCSLSRSLGQSPGLTSHSGPEVPLGQWQRKPSARSSQRPPWQGWLAHEFSCSSQCRPPKPRGHTHW